MRAGYRLVIARPGQEPGTMPELRQILLQKWRCSQHRANPHPACEFSA